MKLKPLVEKIKRSNLFIAIGLVLVLLSSIITITQGVDIVVHYYQNTLGYDSQWLDTLSKLSADTNIGYFQSLIGEPVFINKLNSGNLEYIFVNKLFYVQAITDKDKRVLAYSVTTRNRNFNPTIKFGPWSYDGSDDWKTPTVILGKTTFGELNGLLDEDPFNIVSYLGAHDVFYSEEYEFGNPGNYQTFFFAQNGSGYLNNAYPPMIEGDYHNVSSTNPDVQKYRTAAIINTYTVTAPFIGAKELGNTFFDDLILGPNYDQVRILNQ